MAIVSPEDASNFCLWLTKRHSGFGVFRLPTKAEWMLAAYGSTRSYPWGDNWNIGIPHVSRSLANGHVAPVPVGRPTRDVTPEGIRHLWGNVAEYIQSPTAPFDVYWMGASFSSHPEKNSFPFQPRQGYWGMSHGGVPNERTGFRILLEPKGSPAAAKAAPASVGGTP